MKDKYEITNIEGESEIYDTKEEAIKRIKDLNEWINYEALEIYGDALDGSYELSLVDDIGTELIYAEKRTTEGHKNPVWRIYQDDTSRYTKIAETNEEMMDFVNEMKETLEDNLRKKLTKLEDIK